MSCDYPGCEKETTIEYLYNDPNWREGESVGFNQEACCKAHMQSLSGADLAEDYTIWRLENGKFEYARFEDLT